MPTSSSSTMSTYGNLGDGGGGRGGGGSHRRSASRLLLPEAVPSGGGTRVHAEGEEQFRAAVGGAGTGGGGTGGGAMRGGGGLGGELLVPPTPATHASSSSTGSQTLIAGLRRARSTALHAMGTTSSGPRSCGRSRRYAASRCPGVHEHRRWAPDNPDAVRSAGRSGK